MSLLAGGIGTERREAGMAAGYAPAGLPCRNSNNSTQKQGYRVYEVRSHFINRATGEVIVGSTVHLEDSAGRHLDDHGEGAFRVSGSLTSAEARAAFSLRQNVEAFVAHWGREHCGFFTLTDGEGLPVHNSSRRRRASVSSLGAPLFARIQFPGYSVGLQ